MLVSKLEPYRPRRRWFRRVRHDRRLRRHVDEGLITVSDAQAVAALAACNPLRYRFTHGDVTARNVVRDSTGRLVLIDWEWAGLYPTGYELAFLWLSLVDVAGGREIVGNAGTSRRASLTAGRGTVPRDTVRRRVFWTGQVGSWRRTGFWRPGGCSSMASGEGGRERWSEVCAQFLDGDHRYAPAEGEALHRGAGQHVPVGPHDLADGGDGG